MVSQKTYSTLFHIAEHILYIDTLSITHKRQPSLQYISFMILVLMIHGIRAENGIDYYTRIPG